MLGGGALCACVFRATFNGMEVPTLSAWRPVLVHRRTPSVVFRPVYETESNLHCGAKAALPPVAVCRVACLEWKLRIGKLCAVYHGHDER